MSIYEEHLARDLEEIRAEVQQVGTLVANAIEQAFKSLLTGNRELAYETILKDQIINRAAQKIDALCHAFVVRHSPSAGHLRFVSSVLRISIALERVGDYAVTLCREMARLSRKPDRKVVLDLEISAEPAKQSLRQALEAFQSRNAELARGTKEMASHLGKTFDKAFADLVEEGEKSRLPIRDLFALLLIFNRLSRVCDQAQNICEETVFVALGKTKPAKRFKILFVDEKDDCLSQMALSIAQDKFAGRANYASAGWAPAAELRADLVSFMESRGHNLQDSRPAQLEPASEMLSEFNIIVSLEKDLSRHLKQAPYHTVVLNWKVAEESVEPESSPDYEQIYETLTSKLAGLMEVLTGETAD